MRPDGLLKAPLRWVKDRNEAVYDFLITNKNPKRLLREVLVGAVVLGLLAGVLWGVTGQSVGEAPVVVVESGSMMHCANGVGPQGNACEANRYGRFGTIDPGDLIFVHDVQSADDVATMAAGGKSRYGHAGDVIIYQPNGNPAFTPVIHRALFYLDVQSEDGHPVFGVPELGLTGLWNETHPNDSLNVRELRDALGISPRSPKISIHGLLSLQPEDSGFITQGDNNVGWDQSGNLPISGPVRAEWIIGKSRGEIPWIGLVKIGFSDITTGTDNYDRYATSDLKTMMWVSLVVLIGGPWAYEKVRNRMKPRETEAVGPVQEVEMDPGEDE